MIFITPRAPIITGLVIGLKFHILLISISRSLYLLCLSNSYQAFPYLAIACYFPQDVKIFCCFKLTSFAFVDDDVLLLLLNHCQSLLAMLFVSFVICWRQKYIQQMDAMILRVLCFLLLP